MAYKLNPYLNFDGNCEEAMNFYKDALGVDFVGGGIMKMGDMPPGGPEMSDEDKKRVMHCALPVGNNILMASDTWSGAPAKFVEGTNNYLSVNVDSNEEADRLFASLSTGGKIEMPMSQQFFGYFGSFTDKFGVQWMIIHDGEMTSNL